MKWSYAFLNWLITIYIGSCIALIPNGTFEKIVGDYTFVFIFSLIFSVPGFFIYILVFYILNLFPVNIYLAKSILIIVSMVLILSTPWLIFHEIDYRAFVPYFIPALICGIFLPLRKSSKTTYSSPGPM